MRSKQCTYCRFSLPLPRDHDCREAAVDHKFELNRVVWRQRIYHPPANADRVRLRNLSAYRRIEILKSRYTENEAKNKYFQ